MPPANGWVWVKGGQKYKTIYALPPFFSEKLQKPKNFPSIFFDFARPIFSEKGKEIFPVLGLKFLQNFRAEAERRLNRILEKSSSSVENGALARTRHAYGWSPEG